MDFKEISTNTKNWVDSAQDKDYLESSCECGNELQCSISKGIIITITDRLVGLVVSMSDY